MSPNIGLFSVMAFSLFVRVIRGPNSLNAKNFQRQRLVIRLPKRLGAERRHQLRRATVNATQAEQRRADPRLRSQRPHRDGEIADAKKAFIDPYIASTMKQFVAMGAKPEQSPDSSRNRWRQS